MVRFTWLNMQNGLVGHNRSVFYLALSQSDHYWGRYEWLQPKWVPNGYLGRKGLNSLVCWSNIAKYCTKSWGNYTTTLFTWAVENFVIFHLVWLHSTSAAEHIDGWIWEDSRRARWDTSWGYHSCWRGHWRGKLLGRIWEIFSGVTWRWWVFSLSCSGPEDVYCCFMFLLLLRFVASN